MSPSSLLVGRQKGEEIVNSGPAVHLAKDLEPSRLLVFGALVSGRPLPAQRSEELPSSRETKGRKSVMFFGVFPAQQHPKDMCTGLSSPRGLRMGPWDTATHHKNPVVKLKLPLGHQKLCLGC